MSGATKKWKQIIGYFLHKGPLSWISLRELVYRALQYCSDANLTVIAIVCDQETSQVRLMREMGVTIHTPFINDPAGDHHKIAVIPDPPHLMKNFRNNLMKHDIEVRIALMIILLHACMHTSHELGRYVGSVS